MWHIKRIDTNNTSDFLLECSGTDQQVMVDVFNDATNETRTITACMSLDPAHFCVLLDALSVSLGSSDTDWNTACPFE